MEEAANHNEGFRELLEMKAWGKLLEMAEKEGE